MFYQPHMMCSVCLSVTRSVESGSENYHLWSVPCCSVFRVVSAPVSLTTGPSSAFWDQVAESSLLLLVCIITMLLPM